MNDRIRLAEAMGWKWDESVRPRDFEGFPHWPCWITPNKDKWFGPSHMPDPENDANDCDALIDHLKSLDWTYQIQGCKQSVAVFIWREDDDGEIEDHAYRGDDWKQGVVELAIKVLDTGQDDG